MVQGRLVQRGWTEGTPGHTRFHSEGLKCGRWRPVAVHLQVVDNLRPPTAVHSRNRKWLFCEHAQGSTLICKTVLYLKQMVF